MTKLANTDNSQYSADFGSSTTSSCALKGGRRTGRKRTFRKKSMKKRNMKNFEALTSLFLTGVNLTYTLMGNSRKLPSATFSVLSPYPAIRLLQVLPQNFMVISPMFQ